MARVSAVASHGGSGGQRGIAVLVCLLMLLMVMLLGVSAAQLSLQGEKVARAERDREIAFQAAEDALADAEFDIQGGPEADAGDSPAAPAGGVADGATDGATGAAALARRAAFGAEGAPWFASACGDGAAAGAAQGLRARAAEGEAPAWQSVDLSGADDGGACSSAYGAFTGAAMRTGEGNLPFKKPRYVIERLACHEPGDDAAMEAAPRYCYRITVMGFGAKPATETVLQSVYRKVE